MKNKLSGIFIRPLSFSWLLLLFFVTILSGLIIMSVLFYRNSNSFDNTAYWIKHTRKVIDQTAILSSLSKDLQWETRNFILTGDSSSLQSYLNIRKALNAGSENLAKLVLDNTAQRQRTAILQKQFNDLLDFTDKSIQQKRIKGFSNIDFMRNVQQQVTFHNIINTQIEQIRAEENRLLSVREAANNKNIEAVHNVFLTLGILIVLLFSGTCAIAYFYFKKRQKIERSLAESENRFRVLINSTKDLAIFMTDGKGYILNWFEGAHRIKGYDKEEVIGKDISIFYTPEAIQSGEPKQNLQAAAEQGSFETEGWRVRKNGSRFWADVLITAVYDEDGNVQGFTKVTRDFSLHKQAEDEIKNLLDKEKELNEMKSNFVSMASHEFRTPLSTILSSVSLLEHYKTTETQDKRDKHISRIKSSVSEMVSTLEEFLSLEKIEEGKVHVKKEMFNLKELVEHTYAKFNTQLKQGQVITYEHSGNEEVCLDAAFINHILNNLLSNAVKYSPEGTKVIFETSVNENTVMLKVQDQGIGISPEDQDHLFERFFRASNTGNIKGTGLGLHIVKRYIDLMQGSISLESEIGKGSTFTVILPS